jgi:hypothetical protein
VFEVIGTNNNTGKELSLCRELDAHGGSIAGTEFLLDKNSAFSAIGSHGVSFPLKPNAYRHVTVVDVDGGIYELKDMPYKCEPLPEKSSDWLLLRHLDGKDWAITEKSDGQLVSLFRNEHTSGRWICNVLDSSTSMAKRVKSKREKGYKVASSSKKTWKNAQKAFS